ncbi:hypothetical protein [Myxococcus landrumensis]|uniref:Outer membrane protein beta-barrel domain-containing protein n=1 Tax=Myxococcus landrumensis TaxID=2813577 RepID=A0ABX7NI10_9BACT|nr:hypothetical protein [Myxococcus landrumus]QSQ18013.1 hypothetical protein JY572_19185 [Myxococcus landrumus]
MRHLRIPMASLSVLLATQAWAEPPARSLGVTVFPVGAYVLKDAEGERGVGYSAGLAWSYRRELSVLEVGGHVASNRQLTEATPMSLRLTPAGPRRVRPYLGLGLSLMMAHDEEVARTLQLGMELCGGVTVELSRKLFVSGELRYQNFSSNGSPFAGERQELSSAFLGLGVHL